MEAKGVNGTVIFDGTWITLARRGFLARTSVGKGEKRFSVSDISTIQWRPAGRMLSGFIQFGLPGAQEQRSQFGHQVTDAGNDENAVLFNWKQREQFAQLRDAIEQAQRARIGGPGFAPQPPPPGWYANTAGPGQRWWDGQQWTPNVR